MNMIASNNNIIEELQDQIIIIETKLKQLRIFYITYKGKYDYELAENFFKNLQDFIEETNSQLTKSNNYNLYLETIKSINNILPENENETLKQQNKANQLFYSICNEEQDKLINLMYINEKKLKIYEDILEVYLNPNYNCDDISNELEIKPEYNISVITNIIFLIMILFIIIVIMVTVFMIDQYHLPYNYNNEQCSKFFNKQSKLVM